MRLRHCDGAIVSMHQSGTHWLKFMLASAMAAHYATPPPRYNHANDIIGGFSDPRPPDPLPDLKSTHSIPPLVTPLLISSRIVRLPPLVLLVRDLRVSLVSNYRKWQSRYDVPFATFLRGEPSGRRYNSDIWWCFRFHNAWGPLAARAASTIRIVRYEDLEARPLETLRDVANHLGLSLSAASLAHGIDAASKPAMLARADPARPPGEINRSDEDPFAYYDEDDRAFVTSRCAAYLRHPFGYDYSRF